MFPSLVPLGSKSVRQITCASSGRPLMKATDAGSRPRARAQVWRAKPSRRPQTFPSFVPLPSKPASTCSRTGSGRACRNCWARASRPQVCAKPSVAESHAGGAAHCGATSAACCLFDSCWPVHSTRSRFCSSSGKVFRWSAVARSRPVKRAQTRRTNARSRPQMLPSFVPDGSKVVTTVACTSSGKACRKAVAPASRPSVCPKS
mmetsp:Transcript_1884/g.5717  ORF Transcript_1884/g.5717 Transcript_1884/m.5717 type:complete len:204 (-) Transcript_1884:166-777(-)